jgi:uncharacterized protein (TIGR03118 family)
MRNLFRTLSRTWPRRKGSRKAAAFRPSLEGLETRSLLSGNVLQTNLVSDLPGVAQVLDPNLVNPWGISESGGSAFWISDNNSGLATLYNVPGANNTPVSINPLVVSIPTPGDPLGASGAPTGTVFNTTRAGFDLPHTTAKAIFIFATEDGTIVGWNPGVNPAGSDPAKAGTFGTLAVDNSTTPDAVHGAVYKGLTIATDPNNAPIFTGDANSQTVLYAANFRSGKIDVFDTTFGQVKLPQGAFTDPNLPKGYAPFNVQELNGKIYVTYAKQDLSKHDDVAGKGNGFVDVYNLDGSGEQRLVTRGALDSPWGLAIAPQGFAGLSAPNGDPVLLVGNFGNGRINAYDATTGASLGALKDPDGEPIQIDGLWSLKVGNGGAGGFTNTVYFTAGLDNQMHGLFGSLTTAAPGSPEGDAEAQAVQANLDIFQLNVTALQNDLAKGAPDATIIQDIRTVEQSLVTLIQSEIQFEKDTFHDLGLHHAGGAAGSLQGALDQIFADLGSL